MSKTVEELDFKVIIDDKDFNAKIEEVKRQAKELNTSLSSCLDLTKMSKVSNDKILEDLKKMTSKQRSLEKSVYNTAAAMQKFQLGLKKVATEAERNVTQQERTRKAMQDTAAATARAELAAEKIATQAVRTATEVARQSAAQSKATEAAVKAELAQRRLTESVKEQNINLGTSSKLWQEIGTMAMAYFSIDGARRLISNLVTITAEFEKQRVSLEAILRDVNGADALFEKIKSLAVVSPFNFKELVTYTKQLSAYSVPMGELYDTTKMLADVSAGLGVGMDRLILAYGQIRSASFLRGQEVRQLTEAGAPILQELSALLGQIEGKYVSVGEVFDRISKRQVTFEMIAEIFKKMTSEGGKFYNMQEVLAGTLAGKISNLKDAYQIMFSEIGEQTNGLLVGSVDALRSITENYEKIGRTILEIVAVIGTYKAAVLTMQAVELTRYFYTLAKGANVAAPAIAALTEVIKANTIVQRAASLISKTNPYALIAAGVTAAVIAFANYKRELTSIEKLEKSVNDTKEDYNKNISKEVSALDALYAKLKLAKEGTESYDNAKKAIMSKYGDYINQLRKEGKEVDNLASIYDDLKEKIREASKEKYKTQATSSLDEQYASQMDSFYKEYNKAAKKLARERRSELTQLESEALWQYTSGVLTMWDIESTKGLERLKADLNNANFGSSGDFKRLRMRMTEYTNAYQKNLIAIETAYDSLNKKSDEHVENLRPWQEQVKKVIDEAEKAGVALAGINISENISASEFTESLKKAIKETRESYEMFSKLPGEQEAAELEKRRLGYLNEINKVVGGLGTDAKYENQEKEKAVKALEDEIKLYRELKKAYEEYLSLSDENTARKMLKLQYGEAVGDMVDVSDFDSKIKELLGKLMVIDSDAAEKLGASFSDAIQNMWVKSAQARKKFNDELRTWIEKSFELEGDGISFDISKLISKMSIKDAGTDALVRQLTEQLLKSKSAIMAEAATLGADPNEYWKSYLSAGLQTIEKLSNQEKENNKRNTQEAINDLAKKYSDEAIRSIFGKMTISWGDKSLSSIHTALEKLRALRDSISTHVSDEVKSQAESAGVSIDELIKKVEELLGVDIAEGMRKEFEDTMKVFGTMINAISDLANIFDSIDATPIAESLRGIEELANIAIEYAKGASDLITDAAQAAGEAAEGGADNANSATVVAMVVKLIIFSLKQLVSGITIASERQRDLRDAALEYQNILNDTAKKQASTIFGEDSIALLSTQLDIIAQKEKNLADRTSELFSGFKWDLHKGIMWNNNDIIRQINAVIGGDLILDDGTINFDKLRASMELIIKEFGPNMRNQIQAIIDAEEELKAANEELADSYTNLFGDLASSMVDTMLAAYDEIGNATADLSAVFEDLGETILKSLMQSFILENILNKYKLDFANMVNSYTTSTQTVEDAKKLAQEASNIADKIKKDTEGLSDAFNTIIKAFEDAGLYAKENSNSANTLSNNIQGITENTADLLASYVNAIRADVAGIRSTSTTISNDVKVLLGLVPQQQTLEDYLMKITANQANMISWMQSVTMPHPRGEQGIRVITD